MRLNGTNAIAIVGMACRYPDARTPAELWQTALAMRRAFRRVPDERLPLHDYHSTDPLAQDCTYLTEAAVLEGWEFDRVGFRVSGATFRSTDLAHWLALEVASEALFDAGFPEGAGLPRVTTGVHVGNSLTGDGSRSQSMRLRWPYVRRVAERLLITQGMSEADRNEWLARMEADYKAPFAPMGEESLAGGLSNTIAGRICNHFDLKGGGYTVDGACASSLLAVITSCTALAMRDLDVAIAGGVDLSLDPFELVGFARTGALAAGPMRVYDQRSDGFLPGEGCGMVVLMRHEDAQAEGRRVYALLRGWGVSSDGSGGITRPEPEGQRLALERAYRRAGYGIDTVALFEGHGTGTVVGDATELGVLTRARLEAGATAPAAIGSIKANLGHTKAAAGVAGLMKAALSVHHRVLPPTTGCEQPHDELARPDAVLRVLDLAEAWPADQPVRAAVSAMGFGGIDAHVTLEGIAPASAQTLGAEHARLSNAHQDCEWFVFAGPDRGTVRGEVERLLGGAAQLSHAELADVAAVLAHALPPPEAQVVRASVIAANPAEFRERLGVLHQALSRELGSSSVAPGVILGRGGAEPRLGYLFTGQGAPGHLRGGALRRRCPEVAELYRSAAFSSDADTVSTRVAQPAIVTSSLAGLLALRRFGLEAVAAIGHSLGELTALHWAGAFDESALLRLASARGCAMADRGRADGAMASLGADAETVMALLAELPEVSLAGYNAPRQTVVSGAAESIDALIRRARDKGVHAVRLAVSHAFHSPLVGEAAPVLAEAFAAEQWRALSRTVFSTVAGTRLAAHTPLTSLLLAQVTSPVRFAQALAAAEGAVDLWLEVGPGRVLSTLARENGAAQTISLDAGGDSLAGLFEAVGTAWARGARVDIACWFTDRFAREIDIDRIPRFITNPCEASAEPLAGDDQGPTVASFDSEPSLDQPVAGAAALPLEVVRAVVSARAELPLSAIQPSSRLLADLHLNSISVGEILIAAAKQLGFSPPSAPTEYAHATIAEIAEALASHGALAGPGVGVDVDREPPGVASWVRTFRTEWCALPNFVPPKSQGRWAWEVLAGEDEELAAPLAATLSRSAGVDGVLLCLPARVEESHLTLLLHAARAVIAREGNARLLVVQRGGGAAAFARTLHLEHPEIPVCVVNLSPDSTANLEDIVAELQVTVSFSEVRLEADGRRFGPIMVPVPDDARHRELVLGADDVLLVTGGGKGIAAESALALARATGAGLLLLGRSAPGTDPELKENLERMARCGVRLRYAVADVSDAAAVAAAVAGATGELGPVTCVIHGAGINIPRLLEELDEDHFRQTLEPKLKGARNVLAAIDAGSLRCFVAFGSVIARTGLRGEADYGLANEWLARWVEDLQVRLPDCRCLCIEWSVWSGVGMGQRLGRIDRLAEAGVAALSPDDAVKCLLGLITHGAPCPAVVAAGRLGRMPTLSWAHTPLPLLRFLEEPRVHVPGVELVVDSHLSERRDPYLADHVFRGDRIVPGVMLMEAMTQVRAGLTGIEEAPRFDGLSFLHPVVVPAEGTLTLRVAALVTAPGRVDVLVRSSSTGFQVDHARGTLSGTPGQSSEVQGMHTQEDPLPATGAPLLEPQRDLYGPLMFQGGRFQRVGEYRRLSADRCDVRLTEGHPTRWFGEYLPERLLLGDPAARDAALHAIQACIPHHTILPVSVQSIRSQRLPMQQAWRAHAIERARSSETFVWDLSIRDADEQVVEYWEGVRLAAVRGESAQIPYAPALLGVYVERRLGDLLPGARLRVAIVNGGGPREARSTAVRTALLGSFAGGAPVLERRPDGRRVMPGGSVSIAHGEQHTLAVTAPQVAACDLQEVVARGTDVWAGLLGRTYSQLALELQGGSGGDASVASTRVWCAIECLKKQGVPHDAPLAIASRHTDGWVVLHSGDYGVATYASHATEHEPALVLAVLGTLAARGASGVAQT